MDRGGISKLDDPGFQSTDCRKSLSIGSMDERIWAVHPANDSRSIESPES